MKWKILCVAVLALSACAQGEHSIIVVDGIEYNYFRENDNERPYFGSDPHYVGFQEVKVNGKWVKCDDGFGGYDCEKTVRRVLAEERELNEPSPSGWPDDTDRGDKNDSGVVVVGGGIGSD